MWQETNETRNFMNRRRLILTALGALTGLPFTSQVVKSISAAQKAVPFVSTVPAVPALVPKGSIADLWVTESSDVSAALSALGAPVVKPPRFDRRVYPHEELVEVFVQYRPNVPNLTIQSLIISNEAERDVFLTQMAECIAAALGPLSTA